MPSTEHRHFSRRPLLSFLLAALPALVLGVVSVAYLRYEAYLAEREIREFAAQVTDELVLALNETLRTYADSPERLSHAVDRDTIEWDDIPEPRSDGKDFLEFYSALSDPDSPYDALNRFARNAHLETTTAGLPLGPMTEYRLALEAFESGDREKGISHLIGSLSEAVRRRPSAITGVLLEKVESVATEQDCVEEISLPRYKNLHRKWSRTRELLRSDPSEAGGEAHFPVAVRDPPGHVVALSETELTGLAEGAMKIFRKRTERGPVSLDVGIDFADEGIVSPVAGSAGPLLASAGNGEAFQVSIFAAAPGSVSEAVRRKIVAHGAFLAVVMMLLCYGLWRTWRTIETQHALNRQQANLISSISHELRSPVAGIRLMAERLREKQGDGTEGYPLLIEREAGRLGSLIENVLDIGRISESRKCYVFEPTDIRELVEDSVGRAEVLAGQKHVAVRFVCEDDVPPSPSVDAVAIQQAIGNLMDNAVKFSPPGKTVEVRLETSGRDGGFLVKVSDEGPGIAPREQAKIFDLFYRVGSEMNRETTGTGIGLHLVREIAAAHGGSVEVDSEPGTGSLFKIEIPDCGDD